jgi:RimJ/RimL family protein N-acetyltransferase
MDEPKKGPPRKLATPRLTLQRVDSSLTEQLMPAIESSHAELDRWMGWAADATLASTIDFARQAAVAWDEGSRYEFYLLRNRVPVGTMGVHRVDPILSSAEMGYWIRSDLAGQGLTTEAASAVVSFSFDDVGLHRLELHAGVGNHGSIRVAEKLGFQREGVLRHGSRGIDGFHDAIVFGLLATDPRPQFHSG